MSAENEDAKSGRPVRLVQWMWDRRFVQWIWKKINGCGKLIFRPHVGPRWATFFFSIAASIVVLVIGYFVLSASSVILALPARSGPLDKADVISQLFRDENDELRISLAVVLTASAVV